MASSPPITTVAVDGASGFVGRHVVAALLDRGLRVRALVRDRAKAQASLPTHDRSLTLVEGDALDPEALDRLTRGCEAYVHLIGIIRAVGDQTFERMHVGATHAALEACRRSGISRYLHMSALGVGEQGPSEYQQTKWAAEQAVRRGDLAWTIFRPSMILGDGSEFVEMVRAWSAGEAQPYFFLPYFTRPQEDRSVPMGGTRADPIVQPVAVEDVAEAFARALERPETIGEVYNLAGPEAVSWPQLLTTLSSRLGGKSSIKPWGVPGEIAAVQAMIAQKLGLGSLLPFDRGMALMGMEDSTADTHKARAHLSLVPRRWRVGQAAS